MVSNTRHGYKRLRSISVVFLIQINNGRLKAVEVSQKQYNIHS